MAYATESLTVAVTPVAKKVLVEVISQFVERTGLPVPRPLIREAVGALLDSVSEIDFAAVQEILTSLPISVPASWVGSIWGEFTDRVDADTDCVAVECPASGRTHELTEGPGTYTCGDCGEDIELDDGEAVHAIEVECPVEEESFWAGPEDGAYECPLCGVGVTVEDGEAEHDDVPEVMCPVSRNTVTLEHGEGTYQCPDCGEDIEVDEEGGAAHSRVLTARRRSRVRK